ncbi:TPA: hypothetical protein MC498_004262 [Klebsiella oxytoca]|nr:hypothetical protein [Klebsiella oxytoca]
MDKNHMTNNKFSIDLESSVYCFSSMEGEFPGASSTDALWSLLMEGKPATKNSLLPFWQIDKDLVLSDKPGERNRIYMHHAFTLDEPMGDPSRQLKIGLRVLKKLFKAPNLSTDSLERSRVGLILATSWSDESYFLLDNGISAGEQARIMADQLQLGGPVFTIDTACSSFHYALELARGVMNSGQADSVVVMAINTVLPLPLYLGFSQLMAFSSDACLRAFGEEANGIVPGECVSAFLLEPLVQAKSNGREPLGLLTAVGLSSDGAEGSVFSPGKQGQLTAYKRAWHGRDPATADYLEVHGTATPLGDSIELASIKQFFCEENRRLRPLTLGAIKSVLGHSLAAAGGASLAKALLMLRYQQIPPQPNYTQNRQLDCAELRLSSEKTINTEKLRRLAISSFGFGGANAHIIIDNMDMTHHVQCEKADNNGLIKLNLSIFDAEAALGGTFNLKDFRKQLNQVSEHVPFPLRRLAEPFEKVTEIESGRYLAKDCIIDTHRYAMGPKALDHIDPFKLLVTAITGHIVQRNPEIANNSKTAMMICCNMGGESFSNAYKRSSFFTSLTDSPPDITVADVATMLPSMLSGYAAKIYDFRGFHQTLVGEAGLLWQTLLTIPHWFENGLENILLGAGRYISSHSELRHCQGKKIIQGEGVGVLLLKPWRHEHDALTVLRCAVMGSHAPTLKDACVIAGIELMNITEELTCEIDSDYYESSSALSKCTGWLAEASGIEHLLKQMMMLKGIGVIKVYRQGIPWMWIFSERVNNWEPQRKCADIQRPYTLRFNISDANDMSNNNLKLDKTQLQEVGGLAILHKHVSTYLVESLRTRNAIMKKLLEQSESQSFHEKIIFDLKRCDDGWQSVLRVNEQHPYFFDHPLDHVPGILLIAGALQMITDAGLIKNNQYIDKMNVRFISYVDKYHPINLSLNKSQTDEWTIAVKQQNNNVCIIKITLALNTLTILTNTFSDIVPCSKMKVLHKHRHENVLVGDLFDDHDCYTVFTTQIPDGHFFSQGKVKNLSMVYFLEIARQCYMQIAHEIMQVPLGIPMNLLTLNFSLRGAIPRHHTLRVSTDKAYVTATNGRTNLINISLWIGEQQLGDVRIVGQVLKPESNL